MGKCRLCGRFIKNNDINYGTECITKCYSFLNMEYKGVKNKEINLNNKIARINKKIGLDNYKKTDLTESYLALVLLNRVDIPYYDKYKNRLMERINNIETATKTKNNSIDLQESYEIYKMYNRFLKNIKEENQKIDFSDKTQNIIWDALNFGLSRYYNKKGYLSGITQQLQFVLWKSGVGLLDVGNYKVSAYLLNHAINENPEDLYICEGFIINDIKNDSSFDNKIREIVKNSNSNSINTKDYIAFENGDLAASFHMMDIFITGSKTNDKWYLHVKLEDTYDFTDLKELHEYIDKGFSGLILSTANNAAMISTSCNVLNEYNIKVEFDYEVGD